MAVVGISCRRLHAPNPSYLACWSGAALFTGGGRKLEALCVRRATSPASCFHDTMPFTSGLYFSFCLQPPRCDRRIYSALLTVAAGPPLSSNATSYLAFNPSSKTASSSKSSASA